LSKKIHRHKPKYNIGDIVYHIGREEYYLVEDITVDMMTQQWYHVRILNGNRTTTDSCYYFDHNGTVKVA